MLNLLSNLDFEEVFGFLGQDVGGGGFYSLGVIKAPRNTNRGDFGPAGGLDIADLVTNIYAISPA
jgi:hypothetical protein